MGERIPVKIEMATLDFLTIEIKTCKCTRVVQARTDEWGNIELVV